MQVKQFARVCEHLDIEHPDKKNGYALLYNGVVYQGAWRPLFDADGRFDTLMFANPNGGAPLFVSVTAISMFTVY